MLSDLAFFLTSGTFKLERGSESEEGEGEEERGEG